MDATTFWRLIESTQKGVPADTRAHIDALTTSLAMSTPLEILSFQEQFHAAHRLADTPGLRGAASVLGLACAPDGVVCTPAGFSAFRGWLVARGRETFDRALADPDSLADILAGAPATDGRRAFYQIPGFLEAAPRAWEHVTNLPADCMPLEDLDDSSPIVGVPDATGLRAAFPRLVAFVEEEFREIHARFAARLLKRLISRFWPVGAYALVSFEEAAASEPLIRDAAKRLESLDFRYVCAFAATRVKTAGGRNAPILYHVDAGATTRGLAYVLPKTSRMIFDFESELEDGRILQTQNASGAAAFERLPEKLRETLPYRATAGEIAALHRARMRVSEARVLATMPATPDGAVRRSLALARRKYDDKCSKGWLTRAEFDRLVSPKLRDPDAAWAEFRRMAMIERFDQSE